MLRSSFCLPTEAGPVASYSQVHDQILVYVFEAHLAPRTSVQLSTSWSGHHTPPVSEVQRRAGTLSLFSNCAAFLMKINYSKCVVVSK